MSAWHVLRNGPCVAVYLLQVRHFATIDLKRKLTMQASLFSRVLVVIALIASAAVLAPTMAQAREGAQSVGQGIKCYTGSVLQADGTYKIERICYKGV